MSSPLSILLITSDPALRDELRSALVAMGDRTAAVYTADDSRQGLEIARSRAPRLVITGMTSDLRALAMLSQELTLASPDSTLAAAFRSDAFGHDVSESAVLIEALRCGVKDFLRRPLSAADLKQLVARIIAPAARSRAKQGMVLSFISNKGGVGKSTLAVNVATGLARRNPGRVLLIDASLQMGVAASMLDLQPGNTLAEAARERDRLDETFLRQLTVQHESGLELLAAPANAMDACEVTDEVISRVLTLAARTYDQVIVDTFPVFDRIVVSVLDHSDRAYIVLENVVPALLGATKLLQLLDSLGFPRDRQRMVLNRNASLASSLRPADIAARLDRSIDHVLPYDTNVIQSANLGRPYAMNPSRWFGFGPPLVRLIDDAASVGREVLNGTPAHLNNGADREAAHRPEEAAP